MSSEFSRCNDEVSELAWENGQLAMHGLQLKHQAWSEPLPDILDSIFQHQEFQNMYDLPPPSSAGNWGENSSAHIIQTSSSIGHEKIDVRLKEKVHSILEVENRRANVVQPDQEFESMERENKMARSESGNYFSGRQNSKMKENLDGDNMSKGESIRSPSSSRRHSRASGIHNQSERRRRERINQKMRALQKLVPNASKTDKASMLDEVIDYLKDLQAQVQIMTNARRMHEMAIPLRIQQQQQQQQKQLQMLLLARMGTEMLDFNSFAQHMSPSFSPPSFSPPSFLPPFHNLGVSSTSCLAPPFICMPEAAPPLDPARANIDVSSIHSPVSDFSKVYNTLLAQQSMNMDLLSKMVAIYQQQEANPSSSKTSIKR